MTSIPSEYFINELKGQRNQLADEAAMARAHVLTLMSKVSELQKQVEELKPKDGEIGS